MPALSDRRKPETTGAILHHFRDCHRRMRLSAAADLGRKRDLYAALGVLEYWRYDATCGEFYGEPLVGEYLLDGEYRRF